MSDENPAVDGATPAAPVANAPEATAQENTAPPANAEGQDAPPKDDKPRDEKGRFVQERINELTRARRQAERERDELSARLRDYEARQQAAAPVSDKAPLPADFNYDLDAWGAAVTAHAVKQAEQRAETKFSERAQQTTQEQVFAQYEVREREYAAKDPEYADAFDALKSSVRLQPTTLEVIAMSDVGPAVVKHLGTHLDVADRISRLPPHMAAVEIARIEAQLKAPKPKPVSNAPTPAPTLNGGGKPAPGIREGMSYAEYKAARMKG